MGNTYVNVTVLGAELDDVRRVVPRPAFVAVDDAGIVVFARDDDRGSPVAGPALAAALGCTTVSVGVHDDDFLQ